MSKYEVGSQYDRETPSFCHDILKKFGTDDYGDDIYRLIWSEVPTEVIGGVWEERADPTKGNSIVRKGNMLMDSNPVIMKHAAYKTVAKYPDYLGDKARWILEKKLPCSFSPWMWDYKFLDPASGLHLSGPYPEHGEYWTSKVLTNRGEYVECTADLVEYYARQVAAADEYPDYQKREAYEERQKRKQREYDNHFDAVFHDAQVAGGTMKLFQAVSGPKTNRKSVDDVKFVEAPAYLPKTPGSRQL
jgi:hypothetical protein